MDNEVHTMEEALEVIQRHIEFKQVEAGENLTSREAEMFKALKFILNSLISITNAHQIRLEERQADIFYNLDIEN